MAFKVIYLLHLLQSVSLDLGIISTYSIPLISYTFLKNTYLYIQNILESENYFLEIIGINK